MKTYINLSDMAFYSYHGVLDQENIIGNNYIVNLSIKVDLSKACSSDDVLDTINYAEVYELVQIEMDKASKLLEHVAMRIYNSIIVAFPQIENLEVRLSKLNPPISGEIRAAEVVINH